MAQKTPIFCAACGVHTDHELSNQFGELVATCPCGRFLKFPLGLPRADFDVLIARHKTDNDPKLFAD
jgi:hypothetical protein